jgi:hypothetical protein
MWCCAAGPWVFLGNRLGCWLRGVGVRAIRMDRCECDARMRRQHGCPTCARPERAMSTLPFLRRKRRCWLALWHERLRFGTLRARHCRSACCAEWEGGIRVYPLGCMSYSSRYVTLRLRCTEGW